MYKRQDLFSELVDLDIDYTLVNEAAAQWAMDYAGFIIEQVDGTSADTLGTILADFVRTPGMTIGDIIGRLPYKDARSRMIAVTETTRVYARAEQLAGEALAAEFPDIPVWKTWYTNNDDRVCDICGPLEGREVLIDRSFPSVVGGGFPGPPAHVNCLVGDTNILPIGRIAAGSKRWYEGDVITIETLENKLTVTPNHPILTPEGWVKAKDCVEGESVLECSKRQWKLSLIHI